MVDGRERTVSLTSYSMMKRHESEKQTTITCLPGVVTTTTENELAMPSYADPIKVTFDTNIPQELWREQRNAMIVRKLLTLSDAGVLDLAVSTRIDHDIPHPPLSERISELPDLGITTIGSTLRLGVSRLGSGDMLVDDTVVRAEENISLALERRSGRKPEFVDFDHVFAHYLNHRDVFLTWDEALLAAADLFRDELGVRVVKPEDFIAHMEDRPSIES